MRDEDLVPEDLARLAAAHGVATHYEDHDGRRVDVSIETVRAVLAAMDVPAGSAEEVRAALVAAAEMGWRRLVAPTVLVRVGSATEVAVTAPAGAGQGTAEVTILTAEGGVVAIAPGPGRDWREVGRERLERRTAVLPSTLPIGAHRLTVRAGGREEHAHLLVVPPRCPVPADLRAWGWQVQLYALRSARSWGIGEFADLRTLLATAGREHGAGLVLANPLHAALPVLPQEPSPYSPASRRFTNPLYLRVEECDGYGQLGPADRARVDALAAEARAGNRRDTIDRDAVFRRKSEAFALLAAQPLNAQRAAALAAYRAEEGQGLIDFAAAAALAECHGRSWAAWPVALRDPHSPAVAAARAELADRIALHTWLQFQCDTQLAAAAAAARDAGMPVGLLVDLAVGVDPGGADAWALQADLAARVTVGAPPDSFNQQGQDWQLPPLRPDRLPLTGYEPFRDLVRSQLRHAGGIRIDHAMGLFRLFWIPAGADAADGTYVRYPADALLGVLALEAEAAGALVVGEDLGTVERGVPETLRAHGVLGSRVFWFERREPEPHRSPEASARLPSAEYPVLALTSVTTHDLPTAAGFLADEPARVRAALGQLGHPLEVERARTAAERRELVTLLVDEGLVAPGASDADVVLAMYAFVARTPSLMVTASLGDAIGDLRQPNLPGTVDEYPNWRLPVAAPSGPPPSGPQPLLPPSHPRLLDEILVSPQVTRLAEVLRQGRAGSGYAAQ